jgi:TetR/AcrR family transcriptional repressor of nem operon
VPTARSTPPPLRKQAARRTAEEVLDAAERLAQTRGFNGFSYADVSAIVGIRTASLHYHFPTKADLGRALVERYSRSFRGALAAIEETERGALGRLERYARLYVDVLEKDRLCLCGMLAAEHATLPPAMQAALRAFFDANEAWRVGVLAQGRAAGEVSFQGTPRDSARHWVSTLEGAMLLARSYGDPSRLTAAIRRQLAAHEPR